MNEIEQNTQKGSKSIIPNLLAISIAILLVVPILLMFAANFNTPNQRGAKYACQSTEWDAKKIETLIADYFAIPIHTTVPNFDQLSKWSSVTLSGKNTATIIGTDPYEPIIIMVKDGSGKCPVPYQQAVPDWDGNGVYKLTMSPP